MSQKKAKQQRQTLRRENRDLQFALAEQLRLLEKRCRDFDDGDWGEAVGIATRLRVIFHPGSKAKPSILQSLGAEKTPILGTTEHRESAESILSLDGGLYRQTFGKDESGTYYELSPFFGDSFSKTEIPASKWWGGIVQIKGDEVGNPGRHIYRRMDVVKGIAEHDGGAHLADQVPESHDVLTRPGGLVRLTVGTEESSNEVPIVGVHLAMLRQIAYEALNSTALRELADTGKGNHGDKRNQEPS